jgi:High potential iron-sulfur protein
MKQRRKTVIHLALATGALGLGSQFKPALAMAGPTMDEKDPKAIELGYRKDAATADKAKYPAWAAGQECRSCSNYGGNAGIAAGPCTRMPKPVLAAGWCSGYSKRS